jgi:hypothetical protein
MNETPTAFPWTHGDLTCTGMTLRDYFAAKAMQACITSWIAKNIYPENDLIVAEHAYVVADAMLKAREA